MKILDRYVIVSFIKNYLIAFFVLVGMYVLMDMIFNFDELVEVQEKANVSGVEGVVQIVKAAGNYYFYQLPVFYVHLAGMIPVVAAAFTLIRLSRFNELCAMLAAGVPLMRIAWPIILVGIILNVLLIVDQEILIPRIIPMLTRERSEAMEVAATGGFQISAMQDDRHGILNVARYKPGPGNPVMHAFTLVEHNEKREPVSQLIADKATWDPAEERWVLEKGRRITGLLPDSRREMSDVAEYRSNIKPEEIQLYSSGKYVEWLSTQRINDLLQRPQSYGTLALLRVKHARFTQWILNIVLLLLAIPCVLTRQPTALKAAATRCLLLTGTCLALSFIAFQMAGQPYKPAWAAHWPAVMAWLPILVFGPIAVYLLDRVES